MEPPLMKNTLNIFAIVLMTFFAVTNTFAQDLSREHTTFKSSNVSVFNRTYNTYTIYATYMDQYGAARKFTMFLDAYPSKASSIIYPVVLPEYAVYLNIIRNVDQRQVYVGYLSSDDVYISLSLDKDLPMTVKVHH
jgi:hypothetical protein